MIPTIILISALGCILPALACGPGTGKLGATATFSYEIIPPIVYTYSDSPSQGQISEGVATLLEKNDITDAVSSVLTNNGIPNTNVQVTVVSTPLNAALVEGSCPATAATTPSYETYDKLVYYQCNGANAKTTVIVKQSVTVVAPQAIYESQWNVLSTQIQQQLTTKRNTQFISGLVTVQ